MTRYLVAASRVTVAAARSLDRAFYEEGVDDESAADDPVENVPVDGSSADADADGGDDEVSVLSIEEAG